MNIFLRSLTRSLFLLPLLALLAITSGCASGGGLPWKPIQYETNAVPVVVEIPATTNSIPVPAVVDSAGVVVKAAGVIQVVSEAKTLTNWVQQVSAKVNPVWNTGIEGARDINRLNPTPTAPLIDLGLKGLAVLLTGIAAVQTKRLSGKSDLLHTVISAVEQAKSQDVKDLINQFAVYQVCQRQPSPHTPHTLPVPTRNFLGWGRWGAK